MVDPAHSEYPWNSVYAFSENRLLDGIELEGLEVVMIGEVNTGTCLGISGTTEVGIVIGPDGVSGYATGGYGFDLDVIGGSMRLSVTVYPDMPSIYNAEGEGIIFAFGTGDYGISAAIGAVESGIYTGFNLQFGIGLGVFPVSISYMWTETELSSEQAPKDILQQAKEEMIEEHANLTNEMNDLLKVNDSLNKKLADKTVSDSEKTSAKSTIAENQIRIDEIKKVTSALSTGIKEINRMQIEEGNND